MSWLSSFLHPEKGYKAAQNQLDKSYGESKGYLQPFANHGEEAYGGLAEAMKALLNPEELRNKWESGYNESGAAKNAESTATEHGLNAASSLGLNGSSAALKAIQQGTSQISLQDRQNYLNDLMQKYLHGVSLGQNVYGTGANAAFNLGQNALNYGNNSAQNQFNQTNAPGDQFGKLLGYGAGLVGSASAGPIGGALSAGLSQKAGWSPSGSYNPPASAYPPAYARPWSTTGGA